MRLRLRLPACLTNALRHRFVSRLYIFPLRLVYFSSVYVEEKQIHAPFAFFLNSLLFLLLAMNVYWFSVSVCRAYSRMRDDSITR